MRFAVAALLVFAVAGCRRTPVAPDRAEPTATGGSLETAHGDGLRARVELAADPAVATVPVVVYVLDGANGVTGATVRVTGDRTQGGTAPVVRNAAQVSEGLYRADDFAFSAAGDWMLTADVTLPDDRAVQAETRVSVPAP